MVCPKFEIVLYGRYVAQNLQNCVLILTIFSESRSVETKLEGLCDKKKLVCIFQECAMIGKIFAFCMADGPKFKIVLHDQ